TKMLELKTSANIALGKGKEAMTMQRELYEKNKEVKYLFQLIEQHLQQGNMKAVDSTMKKIETHAENNKNDSLEMATEVPDQLQKVPIHAAIHYTRAFIALQKENYPEAKKRFQLAVKAFPQFSLARKYLELMNTQGRVR
ncbi:MAG: hypothetical protein M3Q97_08280, partial [Bacteroidota bacterium]|nr:hypothetical protein [Bacteroidota bacterium]